MQHLLKLQHREGDDIPLAAVFLDKLFPRSDIGGVVVALGAAPDVIALLGKVAVLLGDQLFVDITR